MNESILTLVGKSARRALAFACITVLAACGGGGGDAGTGGATTVAASGKYSQPAVITVTGVALDQGITVTSPTCTGMTLSSTAPFVSTTTTAYYRCTTSGMANYDVAVARNGATVATTTFTVPAPQVTMRISNGSTLNGDVVFTLAPDKTPVTVNNFLAYVNAGFYDNTIFHRVDSDFVVQGGAFDPGSLAGTDPPKLTNPPIALEVGVGLSNVRATIGMARRTTGPDPANSATSQFFVNVANNVRLDTEVGGYAVFGTVSSGMTLLDRIAQDSCPTVRECQPAVDIVVTSAVQTL